MIACSAIDTCMKSMALASTRVQGQMGSSMCLVPQSPPTLYLSLRSGPSHSGHVRMSTSKTFFGSSVSYLKRFQGSRFGFAISSPRVDRHLLIARSLDHSRTLEKKCIDASFLCLNLKGRALVPNQGILSKIKLNAGWLHWPWKLASVGVVFGLVGSYLSFMLAQSEAASTKDDRENAHALPFINCFHGKKVLADYSVIGIPGDGRCLFRSVVHGSCLSSGKPAPTESLQRQLADELRAKVADEFIKRRKETEWFIEGDFDTYVSHMRNPHVWGGEPELLMASHVLQMPITVYMHDRGGEGLISIAEYGQEYGIEKPIRILYHGFGHYDALQIPGKGPNARL